MSRLIFSLFLLLTALSISACAAQQQGQENSVSAALSSYYPQIKYQQIHPTPVDGVYEVVVENGEILYFVPVSGHMFFGELWTADAHNLTRESKNKLLSSKLKLFPLDQAIKIGDGPNQVIEVTDPDCPFCRQSSDFFAGRDDVTRYVFLFPLDQLHPKAAAKARYILTAEDPELAYEEVFSGKFDSQPIPEVIDNGMLDLHRKVASEIGINGTPRFWINGQHIAGFNPQQFEKLLNK
ncbi:MAG: DsbC family protein [Desulfuromusa sp.]|nr:DsbC family protein [Desulfuromusa sp.]